MVDVVEQAIATVVRPNTIETLIAFFQCERDKDFAELRSCVTRVILSLGFSWLSEIVSFDQVAK